MNNDDYKVRATSAPEKGKANNDAMDLVSNYFQLPKKSVRIVGGRRSSFKILEITG